jgi:lysophospholipase L1-like esterase
MTSPRRTATIRRKRIKKVVFGAITTLLVLTILEGGSRLIGRVEYPPDPLFEGQESSRERNREYDALLFWRLKPNRHKESVGRVTNSLGLRGPEVPVKKGDEFRILSLGESTTYGWKVAYEECYSALLETQLGSVEGKPVRVINAGVPGYTIVQGYAYLKYRGVRLEPDAVMLYFGYNDFLDVAFREKRVALGDGDAGGLTDLELLKQRRQLASRLTDWIYRHSNLARLVGSRVHGANVPTAGDRGERNVHPQRDLPRVPEEDRRTALEGILDLCETRGIDLVIIVPWYHGFDEHIPLLRSFASEYGVTIVDPNEEGHRRIAKAIAEVAFSED